MSFKYHIKITYRLRRHFLIRIRIRYVENHRIFSRYSFFYLLPFMYIILLSFTLYFVSFVLNSCVYIYASLYYIINTLIQSFNKKNILFFYPFTWYQSDGRFGSGFCHVFNSDNPCNEGDYSGEFSGSLSDGPLFFFFFFRQTLFLQALFLHQTFFVRFSPSSFLRRTFPSLVDLLFFDRPLFSDGFQSGHINSIVEHLGSP